jgi:hypothetical protein
LTMNSSEQIVMHLGRTNVSCLPLSRARMSTTRPFCVLKQMLRKTLNAKDASRSPKIDEDELRKPSAPNVIAYSGLWAPAQDPAPA